MITLLQGAVITLEQSARCEMVSEVTGKPCGNAAAWVVGVGSRHSDEQRSCPQHLSRTCWTMRGAEGPGRRDVVLSVRRPTP